MASVKSWIKAARLRTLPLAMSGILMGAALSYLDGGFNPEVTVLAIVTALFIQIFSNFANDYGDSQQGTDNQHRVGPKRTVQSGEISPLQMKVGMIVLIVLSLASGIWYCSPDCRLPIHRRKQSIRICRTGRFGCIPFLRFVAGGWHLFPEYSPN